MNKQISLRRAQVFVAIVEFGGLSNAGKALGLAQSTVSSHLGQLEHDLGMPLFDRRGHEVRLTDAGGVLLSYARSMLSIEAEARSMLARLDTAPVSGLLHIGGTTTVTARLLPRLLAAFVQQYPGVDVDLEVHNTGEITHRVAKGHLPFAVVAAECDHPKIDAIRVTTEAQVVIAAGNHPLAGQRVPPRVLHGSRVLLREEGSTTREYQVRQLQRWGMNDSHTSTVASSSAIIGAVALGFGISCLPRTVAEDALALGRLSEILIDPTPPERPIHLIRPIERPLSRIEELFLEFAREEGSS